jgi:Type II secretion system (T2SS), protein E, N-terminal domain
MVRSERPEVLLFGTSTGAGSSGRVRRVSIDLGRRLIAAGLVTPEEVEAALFFSVVRGVSFTRVLLDRGAIAERGLEDELERVGGLGLRQVSGAAELVAKLPRALCRRLAALPTRTDPATGAVDVAAADPLDPHVGAEMSFHLGSPVRVLRAPVAAVEEAIRRLELDDTDVAERVRPRRMTPASPYGSPQSSHPPPVLEEAPIPLVRKASGHETPAPRNATLVPPAGAPPLGVAIPGPRPMGGITLSPTTAPYPALAADRERALAARPGGAAARPPRGDASAVSFPSKPPDGERITPPYGTPVYTPPANAPAAPEPGYRVAPPGDDPLPRVRAVAEAPEAPAVPPPNGPPVKPTLVSATLASRAADPPANHRRAARPSIGDVAYPASIPSQAPRVGSHRSALPDEDEDGADDVPLALAPKRARAPETGPVLGALRDAGSRDEVIRLAMRGMRLVARRLAVFAVKRDGFYGWACNVALGDEEALRELRIPIEQPSVLATATATALYLGPVPATPAHEALLRVMERASPDVAAVAVRVAGRPALMLLCDELEDTMIATRFLTELAKAVGEALARLIAR